MRNLLLLLIPLGFVGCGSEAPYQTAPLPKKNAPPPAWAEVRPAPDQAELSDEDVDEIDEIIDAMMEEELQDPGPP